MKRMVIWIIIGLGGAIVGGLLVVRHAVQTAAGMPAAEGSGPPTPPKVVDRWQAGIRVDLRTDYGTDPAAMQRLKEKLRDEELRQKPWEGRN